MSGIGISWAICMSAPSARQTTMPVPHYSFFTGRIPFLPPNQQRQSTEGHTHTHPLNGPVSGTTRVSRYQGGKTNLDFTEARHSEWQVCTSLQTDNHANTSPLWFFTGRMPFLPPNQQRQSTEGNLQSTINGLLTLPA